MRTLLYGLYLGHRFLEKWLFLCSTLIDMEKHSNITNMIVSLIIKRHFTLLEVNILWSSNGQMTQAYCGDLSQKEKTSYCHRAYFTERTVDVLYCDNFTSSLFRGAIKLGMGGHKMGEVPIFITNREHVFFRTRVVSCNTTEDNIGLLGSVIYSRFEKNKWRHLKKLDR